MLKTFPNALRLCSYQSVYKKWPATGKLIVSLIRNASYFEHVCLGRIRIYKMNGILALHILRTARGFWKHCKKGVGWILALESHTFCSSKNILHENKFLGLGLGLVDIVCFTLNSVFLIDLKNNDCAEEKDAHGSFFLLLFDPLFLIFLSFFSFFPLPFFPSLPRIICA